MNDCLEAADDLLAAKDREAALSLSAARSIEEAKAGMKMTALPMKQLFLFSC